MFVTKRFATKVHWKFISLRCIWKRCINARSKDALWCLARVDHATVTAPIPIRNYTLLICVARFLHTMAAASVHHNSTDHCLRQSSHNACPSVWIQWWPFRWACYNSANRISKQPCHHHRHKIFTWAPPHRHHRIFPVQNHRHAAQTKMRNSIIMLWIQWFRLQLHHH